MKQMTATASLTYEPINPLGELVRVEAMLIRYQLARRFSVPRITLFSLLDRFFDRFERSAIASMFRRLSGDRWIVAERAVAGALFGTGIVLLRGLAIGDLPELRSMRLVYSELLGWTFAMLLFGAAYLISTFQLRITAIRHFFGFSVTMIYLALCFAFGLGGAPTPFLWPPLGILTIVAASAFVARMASDDTTRPPNE